jgi:hypothetical protein
VNADFAGAKICPAADILAKHTPHPFLSPNWELLESQGLGGEYNYCPVYYCFIRSDSRTGER